ncbi:MAG: hypothetical protein IPO92_13320 [Saprospiraceae bacterium]|nr:hypothetical protein [Saprospiraceae bacterium]
MDYLPLIIQLLSGAVGGNLAGKLMPSASMGTMVNSILGILGGGLGGQLLGMLGMAPQTGMDLMGIIGNIAAGGVGGGVFMAIIGIIKSMMGSKS